MKPRVIVREPETPYQRAVGCWCRKRIHTHSFYSREYGCYSQCEKERRDGHLTCWWHRHYEDEAQALKAEKERAASMSSTSQETEVEPTGSSEESDNANVSVTDGAAEVAPILFERLKEVVGYFDAKAFYGLSDEERRLLSRLKGAMMKASPAFERGDWRSPTRI